MKRQPLLSLASKTEIPEIPEIPAARRLLDVLPLGIFETTVDGRFLYANEAAIRLAGCETFEELASRDLNKEAESRFPRTQFLEQLRRDGNLVALETSWRKRDGQMIEVRENARAVFDEHGEISSIVGTLEDITDRKDMERALRESQERWNFALEGSGDAIWDENAETGKVFRSTRYKEILGFSDTEIGDERDEWLSRIHPSDLARVRAAEAQTEAGSSHYVAEYRLRCKDGSYKWILDRGKVLSRAADGRPQRLLGTISDVTERRRTEEELRRFRDELEQRVFVRTAELAAALEALRDAESRQRALLEAIPDRLFRMDPDGTLIDVAEDRLSLDDTRASLFGALPPETAEELVAAGRRALSTGAVESLEFTLTEVDEVRNYEARMVASGRDEVFAILRDITSRRRIEQALRDSEEQLRQAQKMEAIGRLAGGIAHDFNNLLAVILGQSELLLADGGLRDGEKGRVDSIRGAARRGAALTGQLLAFSRRQVVLPEAVDLNAIVGEIGDILARLIGNDIELVIKVQPNLPHILVDRSQTEQVILNLAVNARDAMPDGGKLAIETRTVEITAAHPTSANLRPGRYAVLSVADSGVGIPPDVLQRIFEPFFTTKEEGTGLGLATVYGIARQSGGDVTVESRLNAGTSFRVYLPFAPSSPEAEAEGTPTAAKSGATNATVLVVEDEEMLRILAREFLVREGYQVTIAASGAEALEIAKTRTEPIQMLVTDVAMPKMSGPELAQQFALLHPEAKILFVSGHTEDRLGVLESGVSFLQKPYTRDGLLLAVAKALGEGHR